MTLLLILAGYLYGMALTGGLVVGFYAQAVPRSKEPDPRLLWTLALLWFLWLPFVLAFVLFTLPLGFTLTVIADGLRLVKTWGRART